jgi:deazaflavin-dependent oxidoreductase (nitroreductase family)
VIASPSSEELRKERFAQREAKDKQGSCAGSRKHRPRQRRAGVNAESPTGRTSATIGLVAVQRRNPIARTGAALLRVRWFVRAPIWLYRAKLGVLFGTRLLMLEHVGRASGLRRYVVLEVVDHSASNRYVVVSGFGDRAQWFRNIEANPQVRVYLGAHPPALATAHRLDPEASTVSLSRYANAHPRSWAKLRPVLEQTLGTRIDEHGTELPMIAIDLDAST